MNAGIRSSGRRNLNLLVQQAGQHCFYLILYGVIGVSESLPAVVLSPVIRERQPVIHHFVLLAFLQALYTGVFPMSKGKHKQG